MSNKKQPWQEQYPSNLPWEFTPSDKTIYEILDEVADNSPERACLNFLDKKYTFKEVQDLVNLMAYSLQKRGLKKGDKIGLCLPNTPYFIISYYAILKAGGTVVNFNPLYTQEELCELIKYSEITTMVTVDLAMIYDKVEKSRRQTDLKDIIICSFSEALAQPKKTLFKIFKRKEIAKIKYDKHHINFTDLVNSKKLLAEAKAEAKKLSESNASRTNNDNSSNNFTTIHEIDNIEITSASQLIPEPLEEVDLNKDVAVIQFTGGTTGTPKGAMLSHSNIVSNEQQVSAWIYDLNPAGEKFLAVLPFFHVFSMTALMNMSITSGSELIMMPRFMIKDTLKAIDKYRPTIFAGVPTIFTAINNYPKLNKYNLSSLKYCISGGASLPLQTKLRFEELVPDAILVEGYGLSESSPVATCNPPHVVRQAKKELISNPLGEGQPASQISVVHNSIGLPLPGTIIEIRDLKDVRKKLPYGERGEIVIKGPQVMLGYFKNSKSTKEALVNGYLRTGDVGYINEQGYTFLTDRIKEIIISSGYNIYPRVIEDALYQHPSVKEVIVIGIPDDYKGEIPKAYVTLKENKKNKQKISPQELIDFANAKLNPLEKIASLEFRKELPKTLIGKLSKKELKAEVETGKK